MIDKIYRFETKMITLETDNIIIEVSNNNNQNIGIKLTEMADNSSEIENEIYFHPDFLSEVIRALTDIQKSNSN